ncbi:MAG TPA: protein-L-isoaspartate(D-aspartate) O-methyltransferase [Candidatus Saccharimonadales bacterium]|nr:protein-L-isoaspartate(D-aspartate) O-methyltransferase [Candidatus Saccharimonadales bacterium]
MSLLERAAAYPSDRDRFIEDVIIPAGVSAPVVSAFEEVDRAEFMLRASRDQAYSDTIISLAEGSTISQPSLVAKMIDLLHLEGTERVLEIGTATGYQAALLSRLTESVDTVEISPQLVYWARSNLKRLHYPNVTVHQGDGLQGVAGRAPFDAIIVTAGLKEMPRTLFDQLAVGGRMVAPVGELPEDCQMKVFTKLSDTEFKNDDMGQCAFVPLYSPESGGWTKEGLQQARDAREAKRQQAIIDSRRELKQHLIAEAGEDGYRAFVREIGFPIGNIMHARVTEDQVLDMVNLFSDFFGRVDDKKNEIKAKPEEVPAEEQIIGRDSEPVELPPEIVIKRT